MDVSLPQTPAARSAAVTALGAGTLGVAGTIASKNVTMLIPAVVFGGVAAGGAASAATLMTERGWNGIETAIGVGASSVVLGTGLGAVIGRGSGTGAIFGMMGGMAFAAGAVTGAITTAASGH